MSMNKTKIILTAVAATLCVLASAQTTAEEFKGRYERLVRAVGYSGVGIETLLDRWEEAFPDDMAVPQARFNYYYHKGLTTSVVSVPGVRRFMGKEPIMSLKDEDGKDVFYFEEDNFDEALFGEALKVADAQIAAHPDELRWYYLKISALVAYEKESPELAAAQLSRLIDRDAKHPAWTPDGAPAGEEVFLQGVGEYCANFFRIGTADGYEYFREISEKMSKQYPKSAVFVANIGSYWQVARKNPKQAIKYYKKALKIDPDDYAANQNLKLVERQLAQAKKK